jgi:hypothetical protein
MPNIIATPEDLKPYLPSAYSNRLENLPNFGIAEEQQLIPIIGQTMYENLQADEPSEWYAALLPYARAVIAPFGYLQNLPFLQTLLSDGGLIRPETDKQRGAFKWEYKEVQEALANLGFSAQERLINFLTLHKADFGTDWEEAEYNNTSDFAFIRNGKDLAKAISIVQPHRCFMHLKPLFAEVGEMEIRSVLGDVYYEALSQRVFAGELADNEGPIVKWIQMASGRLALAKAAQQSNIRFNAGNGFTIADILKEQPEEGRKSPSATQMNSFVTEMNLSATALLDKVSYTLNNNTSHEIFTEYFESSTYVNPHQSGIQLNNDRKGIFSM